MAKYNTRHANKRTQRNVNSKNALQGASSTGPDDESSTSLETNKKRKASKTFVESEKEVKRYKSITSTHDRFCWKCHKIEAEIRCSTCPRSFHSYCVKSKINDNGSCYVCQQETVAKTESIFDEEIELSKLLLHIIDIACPIDRVEYKSIVEWRDSKENEKLICKKDFKLIYDRCVQKGIQYESHLELINDVKWIHHNCIITYGDKSPNTKIAKKVLDIITLELNDAINCSECYSKKMNNENESLAFLNICKTPHPLVWAKVKGWAHWPAKCLKITEGKNPKANVKFFHTHQMSSVPVAKVLALSEEHPSKSYQKSADMELALSERTAYIDIFEEHYGPYPYEPVNTRFDFKKVEEVLGNILNNRKRRRILSGDAFLLSSKKDVNPPAIVDLTDDVNEDDQQSHEVASSINDTQLCDEHPWFSQPTGISISNVISGTDVSLESNSELQVPVTHCETEPVLQNNFGISMPSVESDPFQNSTVFSQNLISSNSMQLCLRNYDRTSGSVNFNAIPPNNNPGEDDDIEILEEVSSSNTKTKGKRSETERILQAIMRHDPNTYSILKEANILGQQLFIKFWANTCKLETPEEIVRKLENEICHLKLQLDDMRKQISHLKNDYEDRLKNADKVLKSLKAELNIQSQKLKEKDEMLEKQNKEVKSIIEKNEKQCKEKVREAKTLKYVEDGISSQMGIASGIVQQSATMIIQETRSLQISNKEVASSSTPHQNMKFNKFVSAKKTVEVARNINRASSTDIY